MDGRTTGAAALYLLCLAAMSSFRNYQTFSFSSRSGDPIQICLEDSRRANWEKNQKNPTVIGGEYPVSPYTYVRATADELPKLCQDGDLAHFKLALERQIERYSEIEPEIHQAKKFKFGCSVYSRQEYSLETARKMLIIANKSGSFPAFITRVEREFDWYKNIGRLEDSVDHPNLVAGKVQFTAYYLPESIEARRLRDRVFKYPFYRKPVGLENVEKTEDSCGNDPLTGIKVSWCLKKGDAFVRVPKRKQIDFDGALKGQGLEIGYVASPIDIAFLMVQGSGSLKFRDQEGGIESKVRINYAGQNGGIRYMLASVLKCAGAKKEEYDGMMPIRKFLEAKGKTKFKYMNYDETYVFFEESEKGPFGTEQIPITERHTLATDPAVVPTGAVTLFTVPRPEGAVDDCQDISSMAIAQDTGGAIKGAHVDWYQGEGTSAGLRANKVNSAGDLFVAVPKNTGREVIDCTP